MKNKIPMLKEYTALEDVPRDWIIFIEPHILRGAFLPCWMWSSNTNTQGYPIWNRRGREKSVRRFVAEMFFYTPEKYRVKMKCQHASCLNPQHMEIVDGK